MATEKSKFEELEDVMKRLEDNNEGRMFVKGSMVIDGEEIVKTSFDTTTSAGLATHLESLRDHCENFVREIKTSDKLDFIRVDYKERATKDSRYQIMMAVEDDFKAIVMQEYKVRDLRERSMKEQKDTRGYKYVQKNYFFPTLDK